MFVVDLERFKALCALYFLNTIQPEELEELKSALNSGEAELRKIFNQTKKEIKGSPLTGRFIDTYIDENESFVSESKLKDVWSYSFLRLFFSHLLSKIKLKLVLTLLIVLVIALSFVSYYAISLNDELNELKVEIARQNSELNLKEDALGVLHSKDLHSMDLKGQNIDPEGFGRVIWSNEAQKTILLATDLPPAGKGKFYQLWFKKDNSYYDIGALSALDNEQTNLFSFINPPLNKNDKNYSFLVTLEKSTKNSKPAGTVYLYGALTN